MPLGGIMVPMRGIDATQHRRDTAPPPCVRAVSRFILAVAVLAVAGCASTAPSAVRGSGTTAPPTSHIDDVSPAHTDESVLPSPPPGDAHPLESVTDGDTIRVTIDGRSEPVRIIGLDSPETRQPGTPVECLAQEATRAAEGLLAPGDTVYLEEDPTQDTRDTFGRVLAHVFLRDGRLFAEEMIRAGFAVHYVYEEVPSIYADRLAAAQAGAEAAQRGLWDPATCGGEPHAPSGAP
jgi:micrococcal nuclease